MVRIINQSNVKYFANIVAFLIKMQERVTYQADWGKPDIKSVVYVIWHENHFALNGLPKDGSTYVLISTSLDGDIISKAVEGIRYKVCRGSSGRKGSVSGTLQMINRLKEGNAVAVMVDGPRGPYHKVKRGAIMMAKEAGVPIVPVHWISTDLTFVHFPSWDRMTVPFGPCRVLNIYGKPIYTDNKSDDEIAREIHDSLEALKIGDKEKFEEAKKLGLWKKKR